jgi:hypothetical protein
MTDPSSDRDDGVGPNRESSIGTPRWVKVLGVIALIVVVLFVVLLVTGGRHRGPSRHFGLDGQDGAAPPSSVVHVYATSGSNE